MTDARDESISNMLKEALRGPMGHNPGLSYRIYVTDDDGSEREFGMVEAVDFGAAVDAARALGAKLICDAVPVIHSAQL
jgi:hypothetical protein